MFEAFYMCSLIYTRTNYARRNNIKMIKYALLSDYVHKFISSLRLMRDHYNFDELTTHIYLNVCVCIDWL